MVKKSGFTLIELLVVISIIAILSVIGLVSYNYFLKNSRDSRRQSDLKLIQSGLEEYFADQFFYPTVTGGQGQPCNNVNGSLKIGCPLKNPGGNKTYLNQVVDDPVSSAHYLYNAKPGSPIQCDNGINGKCSDYCLYANMEVSTNGNTAPANCTFPVGYNYGVIRP